MVALKSENHAIGSVSPVDQTERIIRKVNFLARKYTSKGFQVVRHPDPFDLPRPLEGMDVELLAVGDHVNMVFSVRSSETVVNDRSLVAIARAIEQMPGWEYQLIISNSRKPSAA